MNANAVAISLLPLVFVLVLLLECSRLRCTSAAQRRHLSRRGNALGRKPAPEMGAAAEQLAPFAE